jgi:hypothetical protein
VKRGDRLPLALDGVNVGYAEIESVGDEQVVLIIPAQKVVAQKRTTLDLGAEKPVDTTGTETIVTGVEKPSEALEKPVEEVPAQKPVEPVEAPVAPVTEPVAVTAEDVQEVSDDPTVTE